MGGRASPAWMSSVRRASSRRSPASGVNLATGRPLSVTMISSPALTAFRCSLNRAFNDAIGTRFTLLPFFRYPGD